MCRDPIQQAVYEWRFGEGQHGRDDSPLPPLDVLCYTVRDMAFLATPRTRSKKMEEYSHPGITLIAPLARLEGWLNPRGLQQSDVRGFHSVFMAAVGGPREYGGCNKHSWCKTCENPRCESLVGCCSLVGMLQAAGKPMLALTEGLVNALALHRHLGIPVAAACGSLVRLCAAAEELAFLTRWPYLATLELWTDRKTRPSCRPSRRASSS